jgi:hypothetical protein
MTKEELVQENDEFREILKEMRSRIDEILDEDLDDADETENGE